MPSRQLTEAFDAVLPEALKSYRTTDPVEILRIPAKAADVGDIVVHNDGDELTIAVGRISHRHFEVYCASGSAEPQRQLEVAREAVEWIHGIVAERVRFRVESEAGRIIAGSSWDVRHGDGGRWLSRTDEVREYTWSGEKFHGDRLADNPPLQPTGAAGMISRVRKWLRRGPGR